MQHVDRHALTLLNVFDKAGYFTHEQTLMAYVNLHDDDRPAMPENSFTRFVLTNRQTEKTLDMVVVIVMMSARQQHHRHRQVAKQWHVNQSLNQEDQKCKLIDGMACEVCPARSIAHMIQSIGDSIIWLILTWLNDRCVLQLYLKIMPGVVECLQAQHKWLCCCRTSVPAASTHTGNLTNITCIGCICAV